MKKDIGMKKNGKKKRKNLIIGLCSILFVILLTVGIIYINNNKTVVKVSDNIHNSSKEIESFVKKITVKDLKYAKKDGYEFVSWVDENGVVLDDDKVLSNNDKVYAIYIPKGSKAEPFTFTEWQSFAQTHRITISDKNCLAVSEKTVKGDPNVLGGGINYLYTVYGIKMGQSNVTLDILNDKGNVVSSKTYYFTIDSDLNVILDKASSNEISPSSSNNSGSNKSVYKFTFGHTFAESHNLVIENKNILKVSENVHQNNGALTGGIAYEFTVVGLSTGSSDVVINILRNNEIVLKRTYHFTVDDNLNVIYGGEEEFNYDDNTQSGTTPVNPGNESPVNPGNESPVNPGNESPVNPGNESPVNPGNTVIVPTVREVYEFIATQFPFANYSEKISNKSIISFTKENATNPNIEGGGIVWKYVVSGLKPGRANIVIDGLNEYYDEHNITKKKYYFVVDNDLNVKLEKIDFEENGEVVSGIAMIN